MNVIYPDDKMKNILLYFSNNFINKDGIWDNFKDSLRYEIIDGEFRNVYLYYPLIYDDIYIEVYLLKYDYYNNKIYNVDTDILNFIILFKQNNKIRYTMKCIYD